jgi:UDP-2-acetamido-3-amino-2,3-dideoxy-glucuronate N-acetyltransferase
VSWLHPFKEQKLVVVGEHKMAVFDDLEPTDKLVVYPHTIQWKNNQPVAAKAAGVPVPFEMAEPLRLECQHFLECVRTRQTPRTDGREALRVLRVLSQCQDLLDSASPEDVQPVPEEHLDRAAPLFRDAKPSKDAPHFVHPSTYVDADVQIGNGTTIWHFSHVLSGSKLGKDCRIGQNVVIGPRVTIGDGTKIQNNVSVYEGVTLEEQVFCGPSMVFTNVYNPRSEIRRMDELRETLVGRGASLGANCTIVCGISIGSYAFVGAGAVVTKDVPSHALVVGNPGRVVGWMCKCGNRIRFDADGRAGSCEACQMEYEKADLIVAAR